jgi:hypothetical protein
MKNKKITAKRPKPIPPFKTLDEEAEFWDTHDVTEYLEETEPVEFEVDVQSEIRYYAVERTLANRVREIAQLRGVSAETLVNLWIQEKVSEATV